MQSWKDREYKYIQGCALSYWLGAAAPAHCQQYDHMSTPHIGKWATWDMASRISASRKTLLPFSLILLCNWDAKIASAISIKPFGTAAKSVLSAYAMACNITGWPSLLLRTIRCTFTNFRSSYTF